MVIFLAYATDLVAHFSQWGLEGELHFKKNDYDTNIFSKLKTTLEFQSQNWSWNVYEFPVDYRQIDNKERCNLESKGKRLYDLNDKLGYLTLPGNESSEWTINNDIMGTLIRSFIRIYHLINFLDIDDLWGRSLVLMDTMSDVIICSTIYTNDSSNDYFAEAKFTSNILGSIHFMWKTGKNGELQRALIIAQLIHAPT